jgi:DNA repair exonuclease SbcCD nuclease subunit
MKIGILGDLHFGVRSDSPLVLKFQEKFLEFFFNDLKEKGVNLFVQLGDMFDRRKFVEFYTLKRYREMFEGNLRNFDINAICLVGNHDSYYRNSLEINSLKLLCNSPHIRVIDEVTSLSFIPDVRQPVVKVDLFPWICESNRDQFEKMIESPGRYALGHFEFEGFWMYPGVPCTHGVSKELMKGYKRVYSGHFHTRSEKDNIRYVGSPLDYTMSDCGDPKYHVILDLKTGEEEWVENKVAIIHHRVNFDNFDSLKGKLTDCRLKVEFPIDVSDKQVSEFLTLLREEKPSHIEVDPREEYDSEELESEIPASKMDPLIVVHEELKARKSPDSAIPVATELYGLALNKDKI